MSWTLASFAVLAVALGAGALWYERSRPSARTLALVAALAALAVVGRLAFAPLPNVKPTTAIVLVAGYALGGAPGFAVGATTALVSNLFLSQGPWTPWQMVAWGAVGVFGAALAAGARRGLFGRRRELGRIGLAGACGAAAVGFGMVMDVYQWTLTAESTLGAYVAVSVASLPFNLAHVISSVAFSLVLGPPLLHALGRHVRRAHVRWPAAGATSLTMLVLTAGLALGVGGLVAAPSAEASATSRAAAYLDRAQNTDGGFGASPGSRSVWSFTSDAALGLAAAGRNPADVRRGRRSIMDFTRSVAPRLRGVSDLEKLVLVVRAAGLSPRRFAGRDLVRDLRRKRRGDGSFAGNPSLTAFGVLALRAGGDRAGSARVQGSARWLARRQHADGGFGLGRVSDADITGAALEALGAAGRGGGATADDAVGYLRRAQNADGGFGQTGPQGSNAQSTSWVVQGLVASGRNPDGVRASGNSPLGYLRSLVRANGSIAYSRRSSQTPVWVTAQALAALRRAPLPIPPVRRASRAAGAGTAAAAAGGTSLAAPVAARRARLAKARAAARRRAAEARRRRALAAGRNREKLGPPAPPRTAAALRPARAAVDDPGGSPLVGGLIALGGLTLVGGAWWRWRRGRRPDEVPA